MRKFYLLPLILSFFFSAHAQLSCVGDVILNADSMNCSRIVYNIDPILSNVSIYRVSYKLEGATVRTGGASASGLRFNAGRTKVTYSLPLTTVLECSFYVTIVSKDMVFPDVNSLPPLRGNCSVKVTSAPIARNKCTGDTLVAGTRDPLSYNQPGVYWIDWEYFLYGRLVLTQRQAVIVLNLFIPDIDSLPDVTGKCFAQITTAPTGINTCNNKKIKAITRDPLVYNRRGTYTVNWIFVDNADTIFRQRQRLIVTDNQRIISDIDSLPILFGNCNITITSFPTAKNSCTDSVILSTPLDPVKYSQPGTYRIRWRYIDKQDTLIQFQRVIVRPGTIVPDIPTLPPILANCFVNITKYPTAKNSCTGVVIQAVPLTPVKYDQPGTYAMRWRYIDQTDTLVQTQPVIVRPSRIIPDIDSLPALVGNCTITITSFPTAKNSCTDSVIVSTPLDPVKYGQPGSYIIRWRYIDKRDTLVQFQRIVVRPGTIVPDIDPLQPISGNCSVNITKYPTAKSGCTGTAIQASPLNPVNYDQPGTYTIRWRYIDQRDTLVQTQQVIVIPGRIIPDIDTLKPIHGNCSITITKYPTAKNSCTNVIITAVPLTPVKYDQPGTYFMRWRYIDGRDTLVRGQEVIVHPEALIPDIDTLPILTGCSVKVTTIPTAKNPCTGIPIRAITKDPLSYDKPGNYRINWVYIDKHDTLSQTQQVIVDAGYLVPDSASLLTITGNCSVTITRIPTARNTCSGKIVRAITDDPLVYNTPGKYTILWVYIDSQDVIEQLQTIEVLPGLLIPDIDTLQTITGKCVVTIDKRPTARNNCSGKLITATTNDPLSYDAPGTYKITWSFDDPTARANIVQSQLVVLDDVGQLIPDIASLPDLTSDCSVNITKIPTATNSCNGDKVTAFTTDPLVYTKPGSYMVHWIYRSKYQATVVQNQAVVITGANVLVPEIVSLPDLQGICSVTATDIPFAKNKCSGRLIKAITNDSVTYNRAGNYKIKWMYIDGTDTLVQMQSAIVLSNGRLIPDKVFLPPLVGDCEVRIDKIPTATNSCTKAVFKATTQDPLVYSLPGNYIIRWTFQEGTSIVEQSQVVTVNLKLETIKVGPNPTDDEFTIIRGGCNLSQRLTVRVYDVMGRLMEVTEWNVTDGIRFGHRYPKGIYIVHVTWGDKRFVIKLSKSIRIR